MYIEKLPAGEMLITLEPIEVTYQPVMRLWTARGGKWCERGETRSKALRAYLATMSEGVENEVFKLEGE